MATVGVGGMSIVHVGSGGVVTGFPDTCNTPTGTSDVPVTYPNVAESEDTADGSKSVLCEDESICLAGSTFSSSEGDEAGSNGGVANAMISGIAEPVESSLDVSIEGEGVVLALHQFTFNEDNGATAPVVQDPVVAVPDDGVPTCLICGKPLA